MHEEVLNGRLCHAYRAFHQVASQVKHIAIDINHNHWQNGFVRQRDTKGLTSVKEFYHVPFDKINLCKAQRFSIAGYPCFYIGYSLDVCKAEIGNEGTYVKLYLKDDLKEKIRVVDLTWTTQDYSSCSLEDDLKSWPLIASCYVVPFWCKSQNKVCTDICINFRQEYIIPQLYTLYIKNNIKDAIGLRYYTVRNENLTYGKHEYMNIVLYPKYDREKQCNYDMDLMNMFKWEKPVNLN